MKTSVSFSEIFYTKVGFAVLCGIAGLIYGLASSLIIFIVFKKLSIFHIVKVFVYVFSASGFILGKHSQKLIETMFYPLSFLLGAAFAGSINLFPEVFAGASETRSGTKLQSSNGIFLAALLGFISVMLCFMLW